MVVTEHSFYCLRENFTTKMKLELKNIAKVFLIKANSSLVAFSKSKESSNEVDILIETVKRTELFFFMLDQIKIFGWEKPKLLYSSALLVNKDEPTKKIEDQLVHIDFDISKKDNLSKQNQKLFKNLISTNFINAYHSSNLELFMKGFFGSKWEKRICVLSNIGLFLFTKPDEKNPLHYPTIDSKLQSVERNVYNRSYVFKMRSVSNEEITLAALNQEDYQMWLKAMGKLKEETERRRKDLEKKHQIQDTTEARVSLLKENQRKTSEFNTINLG